MILYFIKVICYVITRAIETIFIFICLSNVCLQMHYYNEQSSLRHWVRSYPNNCSEILLQYNDFFIFLNLALSENFKHRIYLTITNVVWIATFAFSQRLSNCRKMYCIPRRTLFCYIQHAKWLWPYDIHCILLRQNTWQFDCFQTWKQ